MVVLVVSSAWLVVLVLSVVVLVVCCNCSKSASCSPATHPPGLSQEEGWLTATSKKLKKSESQDGIKIAKRLFFFFFAITILAESGKAGEVFVRGKLW